MVASLTREDRLQVMKFVCAFAWADLEVQDAERQCVQKLLDRFELQGSDRALVETWLESPPPPDEVDPTRVPARHRQIVLDAARELFEVDGEVDPKEQEMYDLLKQLLV